MCIANFDLTQELLELINFVYYLKKAKQTMLGIHSN